MKKSVFFLTVIILTLCSCENRKEYTETGLASFYAEEWHGKKTASGEIYDMYALTAAHKTLPFGAIIRIRDLETKKRTWARINNRGPYVEGRILDLSRGAARELGIIEKGVTRVKITVIKWPDEE